MAERVAMLTNTSLEVPGIVGFVVRNEIAVRVEMTVGAVDEQACRDVLGVGTNLEVIATRRLCDIDADRDRECRSSRNPKRG